MKIAIVGVGRAGTAFALALGRAGHDVITVHHDERLSFHDADAVLLTVPDDAIATVAQRLAPTDAVILHVAGSRGLDVLAPHTRVGVLHPLAAIPEGEIGARRFEGSTFAVAGDPLAFELARALGGRALSLRDEQRAAYHAAACVTANHLVALLASVSSIAQSVGLSLEDFLPLAQHALDDVRAMGPTSALTGPASRGDMATLDAHLHAIPEGDRALYVALAREALNLAEQRASSLSS